MAYLIDKKTQGELIARATDDIVALTPLTEILPNSTLDGLIRAIAARVEELYNEAESALLGAYLSTASGPYLDLKANAKGLQRLVSVETRVPCESNTIILRSKDGAKMFDYINPPVGTKYIIVPLGTPVFSTINGGLSFATNESVVILPGATSVSLGVSATLRAGQQIPAGTLNTLTLTGPMFASADFSKLELIQAKSIIGVQSVESDESLRARVAAANQTFASGNFDAITSSILAHPEVADVAINKGVRGTGSFDVVVYPRFNRVSTITIQELQANVKASFGEDYRVISPTYVPVSIQLKSNGTSNFQVVEAVESFFENSRNASVSYRILKDYLRTRGIESEILRLTVNFVDLLPSTTITLFATELFELTPRNASEQAIVVV